MRQPTPISLGSGSSRSRHGAEGDARFVNCYAEEVGPGGKIPYPVYCIDGLKDFATLTDVGTRAMLAVDETLYTVTGRSILSVDVGGNATAIGGIIGDGLVTMARNSASTTQVGACVDGLFKIIEGGVVQTVADADLPPPNSITHLDGYFVFTIPDGRVFASELNDGDNIDGLSFASAEANPDGLVRGATRSRDLVLFGTKSTEFWQNTGGENFPFTRTTSIDRGCLAPGSVADVDETLCWIADDGTVRILNGYQAVRISKHDVERSIDKDANKEDIRAMSWQRRGHTFYAISGTDFTWVYDLTTGHWHERESYGLTRWRCESYVKFQGKHIFGDVATSALYEGDPDTYTESGNPIVMTVQPPPVHAWPASLQFDALYVDLIPGEAANDGNPHNTNPLAMIDYSEDGANTFSSERQIEIGVLGQRKRRVVTRRLGKSGEDGRTFRIRVSAAGVKGITGLAVDVKRLAP